MVDDDATVDGSDNNKGCKCAKTTGYTKTSKSNEGRQAKNGREEMGVQMSLTERLLSEQITVGRTRRKYGG